MPPSPARRILFISNGHGEDAIGAEIVRRLPRGVIPEAYPTLGAGNAYAGLCPVVGPRASLASEGSRVSKGTILRDVRGGLLATILPALNFLRAAAPHYDRVVAIGDIVGVAACFLARIRGIVYLDVYKTGVRRLYSAPERWLIARTASIVFCRHERLAQSLKSLGVDARAAGNVMLETIPFDEYDVEGRRQHPLMLTMLPGSRAAALKNFVLQVDALRLLPRAERPDLFAAVASGLSPYDLGKAANLKLTGPMTSESGDLGTLAERGFVVHLVRGSALGNLLAASDLVLSQAGTATVQALGLGVPVVAMRQPRERQRRFADESALFGEGRIAVPADAQALARATLSLLGNPTERHRRGLDGQSRIGGLGALQAILDTIVS